MENEEFLSKLFKKLATNINFPYYQAERRIDIFINFFIEDIIQQHSIFNNAQFVAPEFPLVKTNESAHAAHIDYLMLDKDKKTILLIELKTDNTSYKQKQIKDYLIESDFKTWFSRYENLKMKGFKPKKNYLAKEVEYLKNNLNSLTTQVVVIKPSINEIEDKSELSDSEKKRTHLIGLKGLEIKTKYQDQWDLLKNIVLQELLEDK